MSRGELSAWYQPQIELRTGKVAAVEALCRWHSPAWGPVSPDVFIPVAEDTGVIVAIGYHMAAEALTVMREWRIEVSVNVSPTQLQNSAFTLWLERQLGRVRRPDRRLGLEITESVDLGPVPAMVARLNRLRALGVGIAIDDYGAGHASLTQLKRLHATELKIDRALIADDSAQGEQLVAAAVAHAHALGARVVAEGIETADHLQRATRLGCDRGQGYFIGRPMPPAQIAQLLTTPRQGSAQSRTLRFRA